MKILFIAMSNSIHTARWINQITEKGWDVHLFPSQDHGEVHPDIKNVTIHHSFYSYKQRLYKPLLRYKGIPILSNFISNAGRYILKKIYPDYRKIQLQRLIKKLRPDIIHSLEFQSAGYLTLDAKKKIKGKFPLWIATNWGSDIYLFGRMTQHKNQIKELLSACDYYSCECQRDVELAQSFGFNGHILPVLPNAGGYDLNLINTLVQVKPTSKRRIILLKGYQGLFGRALVGLRAIALSADSLKGYRVVIYSASKDETVKVAAEILHNDTGINVEIIPLCSHYEMLNLFGQARIYLGLSISDAISTSLLESMIMGTFPIQSNTSSADEWIAHGKTGFIVPPEDPEQIADKIRHAVTDDELVDKAALINYQTARERLDISVIKPKVIAMYEDIFTKVKKRNHS